LAFTNRSSVVVRTVIRLAARLGRLELIGERGRPLFPREVTSFRELDRKRKGLRLPRFGEHRPAFIARKARQRRDPV
jgi:hypothetical protein